MDSVNQKARFVNNLNKTFGSGGGVTCAFSDTELVRFLQFLKAGRQHITVSKGTTIIGMQPNSSVWVLNETCKHNFISALLMLDGAVMSCHYRKIVQQFVLAVGPTETGKSTSIKAALSLFGMTKTGFYVEGSNAYFMEQSALSCLPYGIDEATADNKLLDIVKLIITLSGGAKTANLFNHIQFP